MTTSESIITNPETTSPTKQQPDLTESDNIKPDSTTEKQMTETNNNNNPGIVIKENTDAVSPVDNMDMMPVEQLRLLAKQARIAKDFTTALECFSRALEITVIECGETAPETADIYYEYGEALLENAISKSAIMQEEEQGLIGKLAEGLTSGAAATNFSNSVFVEEHDAAIDEEEKEQPTPAAASSTDDIPDNQQEQEGEEGDEEDVDDLQLSWEILEQARIVYSSLSTPEAKLGLANTHQLLGNVSMESEQWENAIDDFKKALDLKSQHLDKSDREICELNFNLSLVHEYMGKYEEGLKHLEEAKNILLLRLKELTKATSDSKGKGVASTSANSSMTPEQEMLEVEELVKEIDAKVVEIKRKMEEKVKPVVQSSSNNSKPSSTSDASNVNDLNSLVKKKEMPVKEESGGENKRVATDDTDDVNDTKRVKTDK